MQVDNEDIDKLFKILMSLNHNQKFKFEIPNHIWNTIAEFGIPDCEKWNIINNQTQQPENGLIVEEFDRKVRVTLSDHLVPGPAEWCTIVSEKGILRGRCSWIIEFGKGHHKCSWNWGGWNVKVVS